MALWMVRAGKHGEFEPRFLESSRLHLTWGNLEQDLRDVNDRKALIDLLASLYPGAPKTRNVVHAGEIWSFVHNIAVGDWVALPSKLKPAIHIAEVTGPYDFNAKAEPLFRHLRSVKWLVRDIPRTAFDKDVLHSLGSTLTICQIRRNDAEKRVRAMAAAGWTAMPRPALDWLPADEGSAEEEFDLEPMVLS